MALVRFDENKPPQPPEKLFQCANCGRVIAALEQPYLWGEQVVCRTCLPVLQQSVPIAVVSHPCCPRCGSEKIATLRAVYERGTSHSSGGALGFLGNDIGIGEYSSVTQSRAAARASPPEKYSLGGPIGCIVLGAIGVGVGILMASQTDNTDTRPVGVAVAAVCTVLFIVGLVLAVNYSQSNRTKYPRLATKWCRSWMCGTCSSIFQV